jgi:hypothetical protein
MSFKHLPELDEAWRMRSPGARLDEIEKRAPLLRDAIRASGIIRAVRTMDVGRFPYPTVHAFGGACTSTVSYVWLENRSMLVEYKDFEGRTRRLLANPSRPEGSKKAPYFQQFTDKLPGVIEPAFERYIARVGAPLPEQLAKLGVAAGAIDYLTFDHLHVQEVGPLLGPNGLYPKAKLLVTEDELAAVEKLHPLQKYWYVPNGMEGVRREDVITFERDLLLGEGVALVRTPGHTDGNHSIVISLPDGLVTCSENGVAGECYAPEKSDIPGLREHARAMGTKAILNSNTRERTLDQYTSMRLEALLAAAPHADEPPRHFCSSALTKTMLAPGIKPTWSLPVPTYGSPEAA